MIIIQKILAIIFLVLCNVFICSSVSGTVFLILNSYHINKGWSLFIVTLVTLFTYTYLLFNYKIRQFIQKGILK